MSAQSLNSGASRREQLFSAALFKENFKRFWPMELVAFLIYFLSGPFLIMMQSSLRSIISSIVEQEHFVFVLMSLVLPVICCAEVFNYLNIPAATNLIHTQPFSRKTLYITNFISGYVMSIAPAFITMLVLFTLTPFVNSQYPGIVSIGRLLIWFLTVTVVMLFVYSISVLAAVVSGTTIIQILTAFAFNFLLQALYTSLQGYAEQFCFGFSSGSSWEETVRVMNAWTVFIGVDGPFNAEYCLGLLIYTAAATVIAVGAYYVYRIRPLERTGDSYVFTPVQWVIGLLISFFASTLVGLVMMDSFGYMGFIFGGAIGFVISQMIVRKTIRIADKQTAKAALVFALVMVLIISCFALDIFRITGFVPDASQVKEASSYNWMLFNRGNSMVFTDEADIEKLIIFHKEIIANKNRILHPLDDDYFTSNIEISYTLKNGRTIFRSYPVLQSMLEDSKEMEYLYNKNRPTMAEILNDRNYDDIEVYVENMEGSETLSAADKRLLFEAVAKDDRKLDYKGMLQLYNGTRESGDYITSIHVNYNYRGDGWTDYQYQEFFQMIPGWNGYSPGDGYMGGTGYYSYDVWTLETPELYQWIYKMLGEGKLTPAGTDITQTIILNQN